jgi:hypothetical protein
MSRDHEWLELIEVSGPFLALPVLREAFPQGLEELNAPLAKRLRRAYEEWRDAVDSEDRDVARVHEAWIEEVLRTALEVDDGLLRRGDGIPSTSRVELPEHETAIVPELALVDPTRSDALLLPIQVFSPDIDLNASMQFGGLSCSPADLMATYLRAVTCPLGVVTNGERWMVVYAPVGQVSTFTSWYARLWGQEPETLRAFVSLLGVRRLFGREQDRLSTLFERSLKHQDEVTDALGEQVRRAVEVLVQALDRADQDRNRELLTDVRPQELYEAGLTVMMRLVFLLAAEERGLLLLGEPRYDSFYAVSTLRTQLRADNEEILERRRSAWSRLLAVFRAVFGGIDHPTLHLPAMGGSLFDPDRFPFLEGRLKGSSWRQHPATPLPIDDRTVLLLLDAIQTFEGRTLSYRALDVEQIGHVYEGLLERTVTRVQDVTLELDSGADAKNPKVTLGELESARLDGDDAVVALLVERTGRFESSIRNALAREVEGRLSGRLLTACRGDVALRDRLEQYALFLRTDPWGYPLVHPKGAFVVVLGIDRRETGTHYTPTSLTEKIVEQTLTPLVYEGPAKGSPRDSWTLKSPAELLELKVCDPAMGSGAFLVQTCRFLSARLVEAWAVAEASGNIVDTEGRIHGSAADVEPLPKAAEVRAEQARRLVAERCLYGVDLNPLAVELAKLSVWLVTLAKSRPFGFLDHNLRHGDSLLGISRLEQLTELAMSPGTTRQRRLFGKRVQDAVHEALEIRQRLRAIPIRDIRDVEAVAAHNSEARVRLEISQRLADAFIATVFATGNSITLQSRLTALAIEADRATDGDATVLASLEKRSVADLAIDAQGSRPREPFHWPLEFPEVFLREGSGFDAFVGNPPFMGGRRLGRRLGTAYQEYLRIIRNEVVGAPDLCAYFFLRAFSLLRSTGTFGLLATKSITETGSRVVCLDQIISSGGRIYAANSRFPWPGRASVVVSIVWVTRMWSASVLLDGEKVQAIDGALEKDIQLGRPVKLKALKGRFSQGQDLMGRGFELDADERKALLAEDPTCADVIFPLYNGQDLNTMPVLSPRRWAIYFRDWPEAKARAYGPAFRRVEELVKPYRDSLTGQIHQDCFWKFWDLRPNLVREFQAKQYVLAISQNTKHLSVSRVPTRAVYNLKVKILFFEGFRELAVLQSSIHDVWARWCSGTLGASTLSYSTSAVLEPWPMPHLTDELEAIGDRYATLRDEIRLSESVGLTDLYNRFHDPANTSARIEALRSVHLEMDLAVLRAYEWTDVDLEVDFREVGHLPANDRIRLTVSERARAELLKRLTDLNLERHVQEAASGAKARAPGGCAEAAPVEQGALALAEASAPKTSTSTTKGTAPANKASARRTRR